MLESKSQRSSTEATTRGSHGELSAKKRDSLGVKAANLVMLESKSQRSSTEATTRAKEAAQEPKKQDDR